MALPHHINFTAGDISHSICEDCWNDWMDSKPCRDDDFTLSPCCFCNNVRNIDITLWVPIGDDALDDQLKCDATQRQN